MKKLRLLLLLCCFCSCVGAASLADMVDSVKPAVVGVGFYAPLATVSHQLKGTGFAVADGRYVVTNFHVIDAVPEQDNIKFNRVVFVPKGKKHAILEVESVYSDALHDLAILKIKGELPAIPLADPDEVVRDGTEIAVTGFPIGAVLGLYPATHRGIVAAYTPNIISASNSQQLSQAFLKSLKNPFMVYQLDVTAYPGNSGSPVYNVNSGEVIAVINKVFVKQTKEAAISAPSGITYAIPVKHINALAEKHQLF
ncbi:serine protease [Aestuariibacter sp. A3R04]|uniref:S1 family peptidase n=1 Tax=Aestuariibacter sp. A3R04 TaxID=2841571 RepID=UPI001C09DFA0|nr:serine protease [Aestuariibacter sp. A3R04]MBU3021767.1 serine protease [Aestuariibacter sp. A3R04]